MFFVLLYTYLLKRFHSRIAENLNEFLPNLEDIILTGNNLQEFTDLDPLLLLQKLENLSLLSNPVTTQPHYREYIAYKYLKICKQTITFLTEIFYSRFPKLRLLDFRKIRQKERLAAFEFFKSKKGKEALKEIVKKGKLSTSTTNGNEKPTSKGIGLK